MNQRVRTRNKETPEQRAERLAAARNARRNKRYHSDEEYRKKVLAQGRQSYRGSVGASTSREVVSIGKLQYIGESREVTIKGKRRKHITFSVEELAEALGDYNPSVIRRWYQKGQIPKPALEADVVVPRKGNTTGHQRMYVYVIEEVKAIVSILSEHFSEFLYFRKDHEDTVDRIMDQISNIREDFQIDYRN